MNGKYKRGQIWCDHCDAEMVNPGKRCSNCGHRQAGVKIKKSAVLRNCLIEEMEGASTYKELDRFFEEFRL